MPRILFVDDDATIVDCFADLFRALGFTVETAGDARQAIERFEAAGDFSAVVIDRGLPLMSGIELAALLREKDPALRIVLTSGHLWDTLPDRERQAVARLELRFLAKPFSSEELLKLLSFS
ncbi:MAG TPA: response regulator [bacterium]|nr:response regulator [bacterium]